MEDFYANRENWPQSADAFTYVAARKRHVIDIDGFLQKVKICKKANKVNLGSTSFTLEFGTPLLGKKITIDMACLFKPAQAVQTTSDKLIDSYSDEKAGPWIQVKLSAKSELTKEEMRQIAEMERQKARQKMVDEIRQKAENKKKSSEQLKKEIEREDRKAHEAKKKADEIERSAEVNFCKVICELGFLCKNDSILYILEKDIHYFPDPSALKLSSVDLLLSEIMAEKDLIIPDGWCTIICDMEIHLSHRFSHEKKSFLSQLQGGPIIENLSKSFNNPEFSDVLLQVEDEYGALKEFYCHRVLLAAQSTRFAKIFKKKTFTTNRGKCISMIVTDVDAKSMEKILGFIYFGSIAREDISAGLLRAATLYDIEPLKAVCLTSIGDLMTIENAADTLATASRLGNKELEIRAIAYIGDHLKDVALTEGWKNHIETNSSLMKSILLQVAIRQTETPV